MFRLRKIEILMFFLLSVCSMAFNFSVAPTRFEVELDKVNTNEVILINNTAEPMRLESFLEIPKGYENYNLNESIKLYPKMVAIKPGGKQIVRFRVKPNSSVQAGEYKSYIVFKEIPIKNKATEKKDSLDVQIQMITEVGISIYGYYGELNKTIDISNLKFSYNSKSDDLKISGDVDAKGNSSLRITQKVEVLNSNGKVIETLNAQFGRSLRNGKSKIENVVKVQELKNKKVRLTLMDSDGKILSKKTSQTF